MKKLNNDTGTFILNSAEKYGWVVQPDESFLQTVEDGLQQTLKTYGYYLCPCREGWGNRFKDKDITCPCDYAQEDIREYGQCYCGLFMSKEAAASGKAPDAIPDRRPENKYPD